MSDLGTPLMRLKEAHGNPHYTTDDTGIWKTEVLCPDLAAVLAVVDAAKSVLAGNAVNALPTKSSLRTLRAFVDALESPQQ